MIQIPEFLTEEYAKKHCRRRKRHFNTALAWANSMDITEREFNSYLVDLGYQVKQDDERSGNEHRKEKNILGKYLEKYTGIWMRFLMY